MSMTRSLGARLRSRDLGVFTWTNLQATYANGGGALAGLPTGVTAFVSDWGALFTPNAAKTAWIPEARHLQISSAVSSTASPLASLTGVTSGKFSIPGGAPVIPAGLTTTGWHVWLIANLRRTTSTATATIDVRLGTADSSADGIFGTNATAASATALWYDMESGFYSTTGRLREGASPGSTDSRLIGMSAVDITANVDTTAAQYLSFHIASANTADVFQLLSYRFGVRAP